MCTRPCFHFSYLIAFCLMLTGGLARSQESLTIHGYAPKLKDGTLLYLKPFYPRRFSKDQKEDADALRKDLGLIVNNGVFSGKLNVRSGDLYSLSLNKTSSDFICLSPGKLMINLPDSSLNGLKVDGNKTSVEYQLFRADLTGSKANQDFRKAWVDWSKSRMTKDTSTTRRMKRVYDSLAIPSNLLTVKSTLSAIEKNPSSFINSTILYSLLDNLPDAEIKKIFLSLPEKVKRNRYAEELQYLVDSLFVGGYAPVFTQTNTNGVPVNLESYKGKYVLIDFWASWCVPCRADNPNLVKAMNKYKNRNFTILSVSLDAKKELWLDAIKKDGLEWDHVSDLKEFRNEVSMRYNVYSIPDNFLIDPSGKIIAKHLHGTELLNLLGKLLN